MRNSIRKSLQIAGLFLLAGGAIAILAVQVKRYRRSGDAGLTVWFYDQSEKRLYEMPQDAVSPDRGVGGRSGDGVRAIVVAPRAEQKNPAKRRIAYLQEYTPELKNLLERIRAVRASGGEFQERMPPRNSEYFQTNTLVKRLNDVEWHRIDSPEGRMIISGWRSEAAPDGEPLVICPP
jgi:hypothetical protein